MKSLQNSDPLFVSRIEERSDGWDENCPKHLAHHQMK